MLFLLSFVIDLQQLDNCEKIFMRLFLHCKSLMHEIVCGVKGLDLILQFLVVIVTTADCCSTNPLHFEGLILDSSLVLKAPLVLVIL